jgi:hypothetical protein
MYSRDYNTDTASLSLSLEYMATLYLTAVLCIYVE